MKQEIEYKKLIKSCLNGEKIQARNSLCYRSDEETCIKFSTTPLIGLRKTCWKLALREWEWFMSGSNDIKNLHPSVTEWWKPWAREDKVYGNYSCQFRDFAGHGQTVDSIEIFIQGIKYNPYSRRNVITTWNTADMNNDKCPITNCHGTVIQALVSNDNTLTIKTYQRSADVICGVPHNWVQYWAFMLWVCHLTGREPGSLVWIGGDVHIYEQHISLAKEIYNQKTDIRPKLIYSPSTLKFKADDFSLDGTYKYEINKKATMVI
jgi:thymidylate synthase